jgi:hypothetical protein
LEFSTEAKDNLMKTKPRWAVIIWLAVSQLLAIGSLIPWLAFAVYSYAALYSGGSSTWEVIFVSVTFAYPIIIIVCTILAWLLYRAYKDQQALIVTSLFIVVPIFFLVTIYITNLP